MREELDYRREPTRRAVPRHARGNDSIRVPGVWRSFRPVAADARLARRQPSLKHKDDTLRHAHRLPRRCSPLVASVQPDRRDHGDRISAIIPSSRRRAARRLICSTTAESQLPPHSSAAWATYNGWRKGDRRAGRYAYETGLQGAVGELIGIITMGAIIYGPLMEIACAAAPMASSPANTAPPGLRGAAGAAAKRTWDGAARLVLMDARHRSWRCVHASSRQLNFSPFVRTAMEISVKVCGAAGSAAQPPAPGLVVVTMSMIMIMLK